MDRRLKRHTAIESKIGVGELDRLTDAAYDSAIAGISVDRIKALPRDSQMSMVVDVAHEVVSDGMVAHDGYVLRRNGRRYFSVWKAVDTDRIEEKLRQLEEV